MSELKSLQVLKNTESMHMTYILLNMNCSNSFQCKNSADLMRSDHKTCNIYESMWSLITCLVRTNIISKKKKKKSQPSLQSSHNQKHIMYAALGNVCMHARARTHARGTDEPPEGASRVSDLSDRD